MKRPFLFDKNILPDIPTICGMPKPSTDHSIFNPLSANPIKWSNTFKQFVGKLPTNCLSVFDHFVGLALKELRYFWAKKKSTYDNFLV